MITFEILMWIGLWSLISIPVFILLNEDRKTSKLQMECQKIQNEINRDWDIRLKHARALNDRFTEIWRESNERRS